MYDTVDAVGGCKFDIVYTGIGALGWLPDLGLWAEAVADLLRPNGVLYLVEIHPLVVGMVHDGRTLTQDIFEADFTAWHEKGGAYTAPDAVLQHTVTYERAHAISDVITAILDAGLTLELFHEQSYTNTPWPWTERGDDGYYRLPDGWPRFPLTYSLRARQTHDRGHSLGFPRNRGGVLIGYEFVRRLGSVGLCPRLARRVAVRRRPAASSRSCYAGDGGCTRR